MLSGSISLTAPTKVVLPAPNPPATRIFKVAGGAPAAGTGTGAGAGASQSFT